MLRFTVNSSEYSVRYEHALDEVHYSPANPEKPLGKGVTRCFVERVQGRGKQTEVLDVWHGEARRSYKDPWNIVTARRVSLTKAVSGAWPQDRAQRQAFWNAYLSNKLPSSGLLTP
jgi:hypothetical protein